MNDLADSEALSTSQPKLYILRIRFQIADRLFSCDDLVELPNNAFTFVIICIFTVVSILIGLNWAVRLVSKNKL